MINKQSTSTHLKQQTLSLLGLFSQSRKLDSDLVDSAELSQKSPGGRTYNLRNVPQSSSPGMKLLNKK